MDLFTKFQSKKFQSEKFQSEKIKLGQSQNSTFDFGLVCVRLMSH